MTSYFSVQLWLDPQKKISCIFIIHMVPTVNVYFNLSCQMSMFMQQPHSSSMRYYTVFILLSRSSNCGMNKATKKWSGSGLVLITRKCFANWPGNSQNLLPIGNKFKILKKWLKWLGTGSTQTVMDAIKRANGMSHPHPLQTSWLCTRLFGTYSDNQGKYHQILGYSTFEIINCL